jgi:hypothetical protein
MASAAAGHSKATLSHARSVRRTAFLAWQLAKRQHEDSDDAHSSATAALLGAFTKLGCERLCGGGLVTSLDTYLCGVGLVTWRSTLSLLHRHQQWGALSRRRRWATVFDLWHAHHLTEKRLRLAQAAVESKWYCEREGSLRSTVRAFQSCVAQGRLFRRRAHAASQDMLSRLRRRRFVAWTHFTRRAKRQRACVHRMASYSVLAQIGVGWRQLLSNAVRQSMCATIASLHSTMHERMRRIEGMEKCLLEEQRKMSARWLYVLATKSQHRSVLTIMEGCRRRSHAAACLALLPQRVVFRKMVSTLQHWRVASALLFAESTVRAWALMQAMTVMVAASKRAALRAVNKCFHLWFRFSLAEVHREALQLIVELPELLNGPVGGGGGELHAYQRSSQRPGVSVGDYPRKWMPDSHHQFFTGQFIRWHLLVSGDSHCSK